jgi:hypothetical protein
MRPGARQPTGATMDLPDPRAEVEPQIVGSFGCADAKSTLHAGCPKLLHAEHAQRAALQLERLGIEFVRREDHSHVRCLWFH